MDYTRVELSEARPPGQAEELAVQQKVNYAVLKKRPNSSSQRVKPSIRSANSPEPYPAVECVY